MCTRSITALAAAVTMALAACGGGDGGGALSEDDFVDELTDICGDVSKDLDRIEFPADEDYAAFAKDVLAVYEDGLGRLQAIGAAPESLAKDFEDFIAVLEDQVDEIEQLGKAADGDEALKSFDQLTKLSDEQSEIAQDLDVADCDPNDGADTATTVAETTPATAPATTAAPIALPTTVVPVTIPETIPATAPATAPPAGSRFEILDLTTRFIAPDGFYLEAGTPTQGTLDLIAAMPELNEKLLSIGVATLKDSSDNSDVADIWIGISRTDSMPLDWKTLDCPDGGDLRESADGILGIVCLGAADSPVWEIFTATDLDVGISVYTLLPDVPGDLVADAFLAANP
ncbi:MAG: hypothetical protein NTZ21_03330 [Actinobacteria bacterium]|nr:hypothetical protein [Actinomycetota bacterium]